MTQAGTARPPRVVHVEHCMGTVFSIDIRDPGSWDEAIAGAVGLLHDTDRIFSTYRPGSDISRIRRGELTVAAADPRVALVLRLCADAQARTGGFFTASWPAGIDPTGLVKGWAVEQASRLLRAHGSRNHAVNGGGDVQLAGEAAAGQPWRVGVTDPADRTRLLTAVTGRDMAVATSGVAERGPHILSPFTGEPAASLASVTVVGPSLTLADAYATGAFAMGAAALAWAAAVPGYEALLVFPDGTVSCTPAFPLPRTAPAATAARPGARRR